MSNSVLVEFRIEVAISLKFGGLLYLYAGTPDAASWIEYETIGFGRLYPPDSVSDCYRLFLDDEYETQDVADFLQVAYAEI